MKLVRVLARLALLSLAAVAFVGLTNIYGGSLGQPSLTAHWKAVKAHRVSVPEISQVTDFLAACIVVAIYAIGGRLVFRLRLSAVSHSKGRLIRLDLSNASKVTAR